MPCLQKISTLQMLLVYNFSLRCPGSSSKNGFCLKIGLKISMTGGNEAELVRRTKIKETKDHGNRVKKDRSLSSYLPRPRKRMSLVVEFETQKWTNSRETKVISIRNAWFIYICASHMLCARLRWWDPKDLIMFFIDRASDTVVIGALR